VNPWGLVPLPAAVALAGVAVLACARRDGPRGRAALGLAALGALPPLLFLAAVLADPSAAPRPALRGLANVGLMLFLPAWVATSLEFGLPPGRSVRTLLFVAAAAVADGALLAGGAFQASAARVELAADGPMIQLAAAPARVLSGLLLLVGALGIVRAQALGEAARHEGMTPLARAATGIVLVSLAIFLFSAQALLYRAAPLRILALGSLIFLPFAAVIARDLARPGPATGGLPEGVHLAGSSGVLMGLGAFLIALAALGGAIERFVPSRRGIWFEWGGSILLGLGAALGLVPGLRRRFRRWFRVPEFHAAYSWNPWPLLRRARPAVGGPALRRIADIFAEGSSRPAVALWVRIADGRYAPWTTEATELPILEAANPLLTALGTGRRVLDLSTPPSQIELLPAYVENLDLVEGLGFRVFLPLRSGLRNFGLLALAPLAGEAGATEAMRADLYAGEIAVLVWGGLVAWCPEEDRSRGGPEAPPEEPGALAEAAALVARAGAAAARHPLAPESGGRIAAAAEEIARLLQTRATRNGGPRPPTTASADAPAGTASPRAGR